MNRLEECGAIIEAAVAKYNAALTGNDAVAMAAAEKEAKDAATEYADQAELDWFAACKGAEDPISAVLKAPFVGTRKIHLLKENGIPLALEVVDAERQVNLKRLFRYMRRPVQWDTKVQHMSELLVEWTSKDVGLSTEGIRDKFKMSAKAKAEPIPANPLSNTSLLKVLQNVIDSIVFKDDGNGGNTYKANNKDLKFLQHCFTKEGKGRNDIDTAKAVRVTNIVVKILYRILNDLMYSVNFKMVEQSDEAKAKRAERKTEEANSEPAQEPEPIVVPREEVA